MPDAQEVPHTTGKAGYDWDPYSDACQLGDIHSPLIPFHNYRQIHVGEVAFFDGANAKTRADLKPCPPLWTDVAHYWGVMQDLGYESTHPDEKGPLTSTAAFLKNEFTVMAGTGAKPDWASIALKVIIAILGAISIPDLLKIIGH